MMLLVIMPNEAHFPEPESPNETIEKVHFPSFFKDIIL
jgi:hypothetical protein